MAIDQYAEAALGNRDFFLNKPYAIGIIANARSLGFVIVRLDRRDLVWINVTANPTAEWVDALNNKHADIQPTHWRYWNERN